MSLYDRIRLMQCGIEDSKAEYIIQVSNALDVIHDLFCDLCWELLVSRVSKMILPDPPSE